MPSMPAWMQDAMARTTATRTPCKDSGPADKQRPYWACSDDDEEDLLKRYQSIQHELFENDVNHSMENGLCASDRLQRQASSSVNSSVSRQSNVAPMYGGTPTTRQASVLVTPAATPVASPQSTALKRTQSPLTGRTRHSNVNETQLIGSRELRSVQTSALKPPQLPQSDRLAISASSPELAVRARAVETAGATAGGRMASSGMSDRIPGSCSGILGESQHHMNCGFTRATVGGRVYDVTSGGEGGWVNELQMHLTDLKGRALFTEALDRYERFAERHRPAPPAPAGRTSRRGTAEANAGARGQPSRGLTNHSHRAECAPSAPAGKAAPAGFVDDPYADHGEVAVPQTRRPPWSPPVSGKWEKPTTGPNLSAATTRRSAEQNLSGKRRSS